MIFRVPLSPAQEFEKLSRRLEKAERNRARYADNIVPCRGCVEPTRVADVLIDGCPRCAG